MNPDLTLTIHHGQPKSIYNELDKSLPSPRVPNETLDRIIELALFVSPSGLGPRISNSGSFSLIAPFTLASTGFRQLALRRFLHDLQPHSMEHWTGLWQLLTSLEERGIGLPEGGGYKWVRTLCATSSTLSSKLVRLSSLTHLQALSVDFASDGLSTQQPLLKLLFKYLLPPSTTKTSFRLISLTLTSLPRIDTALLRLVARSFPALVELYLSCTERLWFDCCWDCCIDSSECTIHSPIPDTFSDVYSLASAFALALKPLTNLTHLHLGILLSDECLLQTHITHGIDEHAYPPNECAACGELAPVRAMRVRELEASIVIAQKLKTLRSIGWSSLFSNEQRRRQENELEGVEEDDSGGDEMDDKWNTTVWVLRKNGRVRVRRMPW